jgi:threonine aldolase
MKKTFASDNYAGIHPDILQAIINANVGHEKAYSDDSYTQQAIELFKKQFGENIVVYFVLTGTAANVLGLSTLLKPHQAIICPESAHINVDEAGAPENYLGSKLLTIKTSDGKLTVNNIQDQLCFINDQHKAQPKVISITQGTELGTLYSPEEIKKLTDFAHKHGLYVHMDGARLCNAAASLRKTLAELTTDIGIDLLSFGGTKNGMMIGEAVIFFNKDLAKDFKYIRKQGMQLASKSRFIAAQFIALLSNDLWLKNAQHANNMAQFLAEEIAKIPEIKISQPIQANAVFAIIPPQLIPQLQAKYPFYVWNEQTSEIRWMTSFDTTKQDILDFVTFIKETIKNSSLQ